MRQKTDKEPFKKTALMLMIVLGVVIFGAAWYMAQREYAATKTEILAQEEEKLRSWVAGTSDSVKLWEESLDAQIRRISSSELYRLFAMEATALDQKEAALLNDENAQVNSSLAEQVPLMRNVLLDFSNLNGFSDARIVARSGLTLLSSQARPTPLDAMQQQAAQKAMESGVISFSPVFTSVNGLQMYVASPLKPVLSQAEEDVPVAAVVLTMPVTGVIAQFVSRDAENSSNRPSIVQRGEKGFEVILLTSSKPVPITQPFELNKENELPFGLRDSVSGNEEVWSMGSPVPGIDWWVIQEVPNFKIQSMLDARARAIYLFAALASLGVVLLIAVIWWIIIGREQKAVAEHFRELNQIIGEQKRLLDNVNASLDTGLLVVDDNGTIHMSNRAFGEICHCEAKSLDNLNITAVFDTEFAQELLLGVSRVIKSGTAVTEEFSALLDGQNYLFRLTYFPFRDEEDSAAKIKGALITFTDITEFRRQSEIRKRIQANTMQALVGAVESMDPYLSGHSRRMEKLGRLLAKQMNLSADDKDTISTAATLSQIGKLFIPRELLLKETPLTQEERAVFQSSPEKAFDVLKDIDFNLPVPEALHDMYERLDGKGYPRKLQADQIGIHARILGVVNAFCAMTAPRSYRSGMTEDAAIHALRADAAFDQEIVSALDSILHTAEGAASSRNV